MLLTIQNSSIVILPSAVFILEYILNIILVNIAYLK